MILVWYIVIKHMPLKGMVNGPVIFVSFGPGESEDTTCCCDTLCCTSKLLELAPDEAIVTTRQHITGSVAWSYVSMCFQVNTVHAARDDHHK